MGAWRRASQGRRHRAVALTLAGDDDDAHLEIEADIPSDEQPMASGPALPSLDELVVEARTRAQGPLTRPELGARVHVRNERLGPVLARLAASGTVRRLGDRWAIPDSHSLRR